MFSSIFVILFFSRFNLVRSINMEIFRDFQSVFICSKHNGAGVETWMQSWRFLLLMSNHLFPTMRISTNHSSNLLVHLVGWFFHPLQNLSNQWPSNYHKNMISSNILSLGSFFSQHRPLDTFWGLLYYTLTP